MSEGNDVQENTHDAGQETPPQPEEVRFDPAGEASVSVEAADEAVDYEDRDVRVPRDDTDSLAETATGDQSIEDEVRRMAAEELPPPEPVHDDPDDPGVHHASAVEDGVSERPRAEDAPDPNARDAHVAPAPAAKAKPTPQRPAIANAHEAFSMAIRAHAQAKGLALRDQSSFLQILHGETGHKIYMALSQKTPRVHFETTLPVVGQFGATEPTKENGRIAAYLDPSVESGEALGDILALVDLLASGSMGKLPPPRSRQQTGK